MIDKELLELAAKAAGYALGPEWDCAVEGIFLGQGCDGDPHRIWNPLIDDGDALRLAVKLGIIVSFSVDVTAAYAKRWDIVTVNEPTTDEIGQIHNPDLLTATRLAIVRAAAEIGGKTP